MKSASLPPPCSNFCRAKRRLISQPSTSAPVSTCLMSTDSDKKQVHPNFGITTRTTKKNIKLPGKQQQQQQQQQQQEVSLSPRPWPLEPRWSNGAHNCPVPGPAFPGPKHSQTAENQGEIMIDWYQPWIIITWIIDNGCHNRYLDSVGTKKLDNINWFWTVHTRCLQYTQWQYMTILWYCVYKIAKHWPTDTCVFLVSSQSPCFRTGNKWDCYSWVRG